ncbi:MAG: DUF1579 domain-containing protein [Phycisphaerales bacterium]|nr:MAG: DUF1579 domain-containing protein [Phycisphaerales bacterium]
MFAKPQKEHEWLQKLIGEWTFEAECDMGPDQPKTKHGGTEHVRSLGGLWIVADGKGPMPDGEGEANMMLTLGYDPEKKCYVGSWVGSMMTNMWTYKGHINDAGTTLTLETEGPNMMEPGKTARYREAIEFNNNDHRVFTSSAQGPDGKWVTFMTCHYRRTK